MVAQRSPSGGIFLIRLTPQLIHVQNDAQGDDVIDVVLKAQKPFKVL